ncbi:hypothetical protein [Phytoactinopolyspora limicola]|uniref:hypothetical protein n=1 Tax=Phytoactinopolyspora limicola TaxID=2715536 RepID=UPI001A9CB5BB|nr:hypothetical protein [Phytoactinopolyspora limicola]
MNGDPGVVHPLLHMMLAAADGRFPPVDGAVEVVPPPAGGLECSVAFTGHAVVATALSPTMVADQHPDGFGGSLSPDFLRWLAGGGGEVGTIDVTLVATGTGGGGPPERHDAVSHPRVRHAARLRTGVRVFGDERGVVTVAAGLAGRRELSVEAVHDGQGRGWGRSLLADSLGLVPAGEVVFAAVSPGNARSLRAFLSVGFQPVGSEVILRPRRRVRSRAADVRFPGATHHTPPQR